MKYFPKSKSGHSRTFWQGAHNVAVYILLRGTDEKKKLKFFKCLTANQSDWFCVWWVGFVWRCFELRWFGSVFSHCSLTLGRCLGAWSLYLLHSLWPTYSSIRTVDWSPSITETMAVVSKRWCFHVIRFVSYLFGLDGSFKTAVDSAGFYFF